MPLKRLYHRHDTPYSDRKHKIEIKEFSKFHSDKVIFKLFSLLFLTKNRHQGEGFERYLSEDLLDCLEHVKCSSGTYFEPLERISAPEKQISIGWKPLSSSVAFSSFKKVNIANFYSYFLL